MKEYIIPALEVRRGSIVTMNVDAIVNPANSFGFMGGGVSEAIKKMGGEIIEEEAIAQAPIQVGDAVMTIPGVLACKKIIHAPITHNPGARVEVDSVAVAVDAALSLADSEGMKIIAMPGMGTGEGGIKDDVAAKAMIEAIKSRKFLSITTIILVAKEEKLAVAFENEIKKSRK